MRILAVDDDPNFCELLLARLEALGQRNVTMAQSGPEVLQRLRDTDAQVECFLVDLMMSPMSGIELIKRLRQIPRHQATPIIVLSALTDKKSIDEAFLAGANDYITKPLDAVELKIRLSMARSILSERAQARLLQAQLVKEESYRVQNLQFDCGFVFDDVNGMVSQETMENFLMKQGMRRLRNSCTIGLNICEAKTYFDSLDTIHFLDMIEEFASAIARTLYSAPHLLCYAGSGSLVATLLDTPSVNAEHIHEAVSHEMDAVHMRYSRVGLALPQLKVGQPIRPGFLSFEDPTKLITRALRSAKMANGIASQQQPSCAVA